MINESPVGHSRVVQDAGQFFTVRAACASQNIEQLGPCSVNPQSHNTPQIGPHTFQNDQEEVPPLWRTTVLEKLMHREIWTKMLDYYTKTSGKT